MLFNQEGNETSKDSGLTINQILIIGFSVAIIAMVVLFQAKLRVNRGTYSKKLNEIKHAYVGQTVKYGSFDGDPIEWRVLAKENGQTLLITNQCIVKQSYDSVGVSNKWEDSTCRKWLNEEFYKNSFSPMEKRMIKTTLVVNKDNEVYGTDGGSDTEDKVFLLSVEEAGKYFVNDETRKATLLDGRSIWWWLRTTGCHTNDGTFVNMFGEIDDYGHSASYQNVGLRPCIWVDVE